MEVNDFSTGIKTGVWGTKTKLVLSEDHFIEKRDTIGSYNYISYFHGQFVSPSIPILHKEVIMSWQANTPNGTWLEVEVRSKVNDSWSKWYKAGPWLESDLPFKRHSILDQNDEHGILKIDTLILKQWATEAQFKVTLYTTDRKITPVLHSVGISFMKKEMNYSPSQPSGKEMNLDVPKLSQMTLLGGINWCSPVCVSMVLSYWATILGKESLKQSVRKVVRGVWDYSLNIGGNWSFNAAYVASLGLKARVVRLNRLNDVEKWISHSVPVIASIAYGEDELNGAPFQKSNGHLVVVRGFHLNGDIITNDPGAPKNEEVEIIYNREQFEKIWDRHSSKTVYLIHPTDWKIPESEGLW